MVLFRPPRLTLCRLSCWTVGMLFIWTLRHWVRTLRPMSTPQRLLARTCCGFDRRVLQPVDRSQLRIVLLDMGLAGRVDAMAGEPTSRGAGCRLAKCALDATALLRSMERAQACGRDGIATPLTLDESQAFRVRQQIVHALLASFMASEAVVHSLLLCLARLARPVL